MNEDKYAKWHFRISPFIWLPGTRGSVDVPEPPSAQPLPEPPPPYYNFNLQFDDLRTSLKFAMILTGEYRTNKISAGFSYTSLILDGQPIVNYDTLLQDNTFNLNFHTGDLVVGYRAVTNPKLNIDLYGGTRFLFLKAGVSTNLLGRQILSYDGEGVFLDPLFACRIKYIPHHRIEFVGYGDIAPFPTTTTLSFQGTFLINVLLAKNFFIAPGYKILGYRFKDENVNNLYLYGWYMRIGVQF